MKLITLTAAVLACVILQAQARKDLSASTQILYLEPNTCGSWLDARATRSTQAYEGWVLGFLSGANMYADNENDLLKGIDAKSAWVWIDNFCRAQPLKNLYQATAALLQELASAKQNGKGSEAKQ